MDAIPGWAAGGGSVPAHSKPKFHLPAHGKSHAALPEPRAALGSPDSFTALSTETAILATLSS